MTLGEKIRARRKEKGFSVDYVAEQLGISYTTVYRYENSSIEKIPVNVFDNLCRILDITPAELMNYGNKADKSDTLPDTFNTAREAMEFVLKLPTLAAFGGYNPEDMSEETIVEFANEILQQLQLVSYKYKK